MSEEYKIPLRRQIRWFIRGMCSIFVPISQEEIRRDIDQCVEEKMKKWKKENPEPNTKDLTIDEIFNEG